MFSLFLPVCNRSGSIKRFLANLPAGRQGRKGAVSHVLLLRAQRCAAILVFDFLDLQAIPSKTGVVKNKNGYKVESKKIEQWRTCPHFEAVKMVECSLVRGFGVVEICGYLFLGSLMARGFHISRTR